MENELVFSRSCGECTQCCYTHAVTSIKKPEQGWCPDCKIGIGCTRYETRPGQCKVFACEWLAGHGAENERPDRSNCVVAFGVQPLLGPSLGIHETVPGAAERSELAKTRMQYAMKRRMPIMIKRVLGRDTLLLPPAFKISFILRTVLMQKNVAVHRYYTQK